VPNLCTTKRAAAEINHTRDSELPGAVVVSTAVVSGQFDEDACPTATRLEFRVGSRVVLVDSIYRMDGKRGLSSISRSRGRLVSDAPYAPPSR
jgi:hypothetical protein